MTTVEQYILIPLLVIILFLQSTLLFIHAKKHGSYAWFWGIWGLIQFPLPTVFYLIFVVWPRKRQQKMK
ncbi:transcriptional regulator [Niallia sp. Krafla_26]|uniref:transcriptional regulator n=1 Tax=Niallia sp. Krafla_26 TaxID=3064703 RepID=UPI003D168909